jgi:hypothetical protein
VEVAVNLQGSVPALGSQQQVPQLELPPLTPADPSLLIHPKGEEQTAMLQVVKAVSVTIPAIIVVEVLFNEHSWPKP